MSHLAIEEMEAVLHQRMEAMKYHHVFSTVRSVSDLHTFMQWHVFAVWDFMSLVKRLQRDLTCVDLPWLPPQNPAAARLINEIVLGEESDEAFGGGHASHFDLYLQAMREVGAATVQIECFIDAVVSGETIVEALHQADVPVAVKQFVLSTLRTALTGSTEEVLGSFFYGREDVIPHMFQSLLDNWTVDPNAAPTFVYYLKRHIELDGDSHGPAAQTLIDDLLGQDKTSRERLLMSALNAIDHRIRLWDALANELSDIIIERPALAIA